MSAWMASWGNPKIDLIHWNTGIWDLHRTTADGHNFSSLEEYVRDNERLCFQMESYCWATIIPGGDKRIASNALTNSRGEQPQLIRCAPQAEWNADVVRYNQSASQVYRSRGVDINDLYSVLVRDLERYISEDGIHPSAAGHEVLAQRVGKTIKEKLL